MDKQFEEYIAEAMDIKQRMRRRMIMRQHRPKLVRAKKLMSKRVAPMKNIAQRAQKAAIKLIRKRVAGKKGLAYNKLPAAERQQIDRKVAAKQSIVNRIAKRLLPVMRKADLVRLRKVNEEFEAFLIERHDADLTREKNTTIANKTKHGYKVKTAKRKLEAEPTVESVVFDFVAKVMCDDYVLSEKEVKKLSDKSIERDIPYEALKEAYDQGMRSWTDDSDQTPQQLAWHSVNIFVARPDLVEKVLEWGTPEATAFWKKNTPGESNENYTIVGHGAISGMTTPEPRKKKIKKINVDEKFEQFAEITDAQRAAGDKVIQQAISRINKLYSPEKKKKDAAELEKKRQASDSSYSAWQKRKSQPNRIKGPMSSD